MNHWIIHNLREEEGSSLKPRVSSVSCSAHSRTNGRETEGEGENDKKKILASMRHTKVHPLRSKCRRDAQSCLTGLRRYRMPLSHVFVLRRFEDTRESNYGHPSFALASILRTLPGCAVRTIRADGFVFRQVIYARFCEPSSHLAASELEWWYFYRITFVRFFVTNVILPYT